MRSRVCSLLLTLAIVACGAGCASREPPPVPLSILLVTIDTLRADHVRPSIAPALDRLARESLVFDQTVTVAPLTLPAHASLLTGDYPPRHGVRDNHLYSLARDVPMFTESLKARGYATAAFVSAIVLDRRYGLARGFDVYDDEIGPLERPADQTLARAERWMASAPRPFFAWVHLFEPHAPYLAGSYAQEVTAVDHALGTFLDGLRAQHWADTIVSVTADHGESLGEHGEKTHGFYVYDSTLLVPWIVRVPGRLPGRFPHQVRLVDVVPTLAELARVPLAPAAVTSTIDGVSLVPFLEQGRAPALEAYSETFLPRDQFGWSELKSLRTERAKYIAAPTEEAYDLSSDPGELHNVASARRELVASMRRQLAALARVGRTPARSAAQDPVLVERFMSLGYIGYSPPSARGAGAVPADPKEKVEIYRLTMDALESSENGRTDEALARLSAAERLDPDVAQVHFLRGVILGNRGRFADAARALERAVAISPRHISARFKLALAYVRTNRSGQAERVLDGVLRDEPENFRALHNLAAIAYTRGDLDRAEALERQAIAFSADYADAWNTLGAIYIVRRNPAAATDALRRATRLDPGNAQAFRNLAIALRASGNSGEADRAAARACELDGRLCR